MNLSLSSRIANGYGSNNGANVSATVNQGSQSIDGNYTDITYSMSATYFCNAGWTWGGATRTNCGWFDLLINGVTVATIGLSVVAGWGNGTSIGTKSGTYRVTHNADGTKSVTVQIRINSGTDPLNGGVYYQATTGGAQTLTLSTIPRTSKVSLDKSTLECNGSNKFTIKTNRASSSFTHTITYGFGSASGTIATGVGDSTTWTPGKSLLSQIPNAQSGWGRITCKTYSGSTLIGESTVDFTLTVGSTSRPSLSGLTIAEQTSIVSQKAGSNATMALLSNKKITVTASAKDGASVSSVKVTNNGKSVTLSKSGSQYVGSINAVTSGKYTVTVTDSRGLSASLTSNQTFYNYTYPTIAAANFSRTTATGSNGTLTANGAYANMLSNTVTITVTRTGLSATTITGTKSNGSWNFSKSYSDLTYTSSFTATIKITDSFGQVAQLNVVLARSQPVLWIGKTKAIATSLKITGRIERIEFQEYRPNGAYFEIARADKNIADSGGYGSIFIEGTVGGWNAGENGTVGIHVPLRGGGNPKVVFTSGNINTGMGNIVVTLDSSDKIHVYAYIRNYGLYSLQLKGSQFTVPDPVPETTSVNGTVIFSLANTKSPVDVMYPVGSIYMSVNSTDPGTLFGGTWQRIEGRFLLGASSTYGAGTQGGEASHTLTWNEMPVHNHDGYQSGTQIVTTGSLGSDARIQIGGASYRTVPSTANAGNGWSHNNMPPYLAVYIWKRTA